MAWVDANTKLYFPAVVDLNSDAFFAGYIGKSGMVVHYKRNGIEHTDIHVGMGYSGDKGKWLSFVSDKPRVQYQITENRNGWGIRTSNGWEEGLDELVYLTFPENPENYEGTACRLKNFIKLGAYWENEVGETPTIITYNSEDIARLKKGQTATLSCSGKKMTSNVIVSFKSAGSISYNGLITEVEAWKTATLKCAGKKMISDAYVAVKVGVLLSGKYEFVDTPDFSGISPDTKIAVNAKYAGTFTYGDIIEIQFEASSSVTDRITIKRSTCESNFIYTGDSKGWKGSNVIDFLAEPQEVPLLFYDWVMANATKVE